MLWHPVADAILQFGPAIRRHCRGTTALQDWEELQSKAGEAPELPASDGSARRDEEPKLRGVAPVSGRRRSCGEWGRTGAGRAARRPAVPGEEFGRWRRWLGMLVLAGKTATNRSGQGLDKILFS